MIYQNIKKGIFRERPNRFIAYVEIDNNLEVVHVKNTGRCRELLVPGATVFVEYCDNPARKTKYDLITVLKGNRLINMDSSAPNKVFFEWVKDSDYFSDIKIIKPESTYKNSRFDFYIENDHRKNYVEVKGVTLEEDNIVRFPDAPTERGVKHLRELVDAKENGFGAYIVFIVQMKNVKYFTPNTDTHKEFADTLTNAKKAGVKILALDCAVTKSSIKAEDFVPVIL